MAVRPGLRSLRCCWSSAWSRRRRSGRRCCPGERPLITRRSARSRRGSIGWKRRRRRRRSNSSGNKRSCGNSCSRAQQAAAETKTVAGAPQPARSRRWKRGPLAGRCRRYRRVAAAAGEVVAERVRSGGARRRRSRRARRSGARARRRMPRMVMGLLQLRNAVQAGRPFAAEYEAFSALARSRPEIAEAATPLAEPAKTGVAEPGGAGEAAARAGRQYRRGERAGGVRPTPPRRAGAMRRWRGCAGWSRSAASMGRARKEPTPRSTPPSWRWPAATWRRRWRRSRS